MVGVILSNINYLPVASFATTKITVCLGHLLGIIVSSSSTFRYLKLLVRRLSVCTRWNLIYQRCSVESSCKQTKRMLTFSIYLPKCIMYILLGPTNIFSYQKNFKICCYVSFSPAYLHVCKCILLLHVQAPNKKETSFHCFAQRLVGTCALAKRVFACISWWLFNLHLLYGTKKEQGTVDIKPPAVPSFQTNLTQRPNQILNVQGPERLVFPLGLDLEWSVCKIMDPFSSDSQTTNFFTIWFICVW